METVTITIKFTTLQLIGAALQEIPYKLAAPAIQEIEAAVNVFKLAGLEGQKTDLTV